MKIQYLFVRMIDCNQLLRRMGRADVTLADYFRILLGNIVASLSS